MAVALIELYFLIMLTPRILLERPFWPNSKLLQELYKINLSTLLEFGRTTFMNDLNIHCLFYGGIQKYEVGFTGYFLYNGSIYATYL